MRNPEAEAAAAVVVAPQEHGEAIVGAADKLVAEFGRVKGSWQDPGTYQNAPVSPAAKNLPSESLLA